MRLHACVFSMRLYAAITALLLFAATAPVAAEDPPSKPAPEFAELPARGTVHFVSGETEDEVPERFQLKPHEFDYQTKTVRTAGKIRFSRVTFPSPVTTEVVENNTVYGEYFQPAGPGPFPACVVLHILGGDFVLAETVASHLAGRGVAALFVKMPYYGPRRGKNSSKRMISEDPRRIGRRDDARSARYPPRDGVAGPTERSRPDPAGNHRDQPGRDHVGPGGLG